MCEPYYNIQTSKTGFMFFISMNILGPILFKFWKCTQEKQTEARPGAVALYGKGASPFCNHMKIVLEQPHAKNWNFLG